MVERCKGAFGRLNAFQKVMLQWSELCPFNATHVCRIAGPLRADDLRLAVVGTFQRLGLGLVELGDDGISYRHEADDSPEIEVLAGGDSPEQTVQRHVARQLNRRFARPRCRPLRLGAVASSQDCHYLSITYDHWVADSVAMRLLLGHVLAGYCGLETPARLAALQPCPPSYRSAFANRLAGRSLVEALCRWSMGWAAAGHAAQVAHTSASQMAVNFELHRASDGTVPRLVHFARGLGVSVNDVMLAALGRAMAEFLPRRRRRGRLPKIALNSMVDARDDARVDLSTTFGTFIANYVVRCRRDGVMGLGELARSIAATTGPIKRRSFHLDSAVGMKLIGAVWPYVGAALRPRFLRWAMPLTAGVSNVVLREAWLGARGEGPVVDYFRAGPAAPIVPLLLTPTTWGQHLNVGVTYRVTGFCRRKIDGIMEMFMDQIEHAGQTAAPRFDRKHFAKRRREVLSPRTGNRA